MYIARERFLKFLNNYFIWSQSKWRAWWKNSITTIEFYCRNARPSNVIMYFGNCIKNNYCQFLSHIIILGEQGWRSEWEYLPPTNECYPHSNLGSGVIHACTCLYMWAEFVVGSHPCSEGFLLGTLVFLPPQKPTVFYKWKSGQIRATLDKFPLKFPFIFYFYYFIHKYSGTC